MAQSGLVGGSLPDHATPPEHADSSRGGWRVNLMNAMRAGLLTCRKRPADQPLLRHSAEALEAKTAIPRIKGGIHTPEAHTYLILN